MADEFADPHDVDIYASVRDKQYRFIRYEVTQGIARIVLDRPPANVLSIEMMEDINRALEGIEYHREIKLVVLAASGKYFSAGFELADHLGDRGYIMLENFRRIFEFILKLDKPILSLINGSALGAGCVLAVGCDFVLASAGSKFGFPEIKAGVFNTVAAALLPRLVGRKKAIELILGGASLSAGEAERMGLVSKVVPDDRFDAEATAFMQRFQDFSAPVLQAARRAISGGQDQPFLDALRHSEDVYLNQLIGTEDAEEGLRAVLAKRKPVWKNR